jgi:hypothetical protein
MNVHFPDKLAFEDAGLRGDVRLFKLLSIFRYRSSLGVITVPKGFITDGASIPRIFWSLLGPFGPYFQAAIVHDYLYSDRNQSITRDTADHIFKEAMFNSGLDWPRREAIYHAVRIFGGRTFKGPL